MINIRDLVFAYSGGQFVLRIPSLHLNARRTVAVSGPSGSGKTTLLRLIAGILLADSGQTEVLGHQLNDLDDASRRLFRLRNVGLIFQDFQLLDYLSVVENVLIPGRIHPSVRLTSAIRERAEDLLNIVGLSALRHRPVTRLSQGEKQRVAICRALLLSPQLILADEPTGNLDRVNSDRILKLLFRETEACGATLIMVTHDHSLLGRFHQVIPFEQFFTPPESSGTNMSTDASASRESDLTADAGRAEVDGRGAGSRDSEIERGEGSS